jgi:PleD family two-component response regulator
MAAAKKILLVEDDLDLSEMLVGFFVAQGFAITATEFGEEGLRLAHESQPDIVLLDIRLPDTDGYSICRRLRQERQTANVPVIFLTERRDRADRLAGLELGAVDYITKPFDILELRLRVRNALRRAQFQPLVNPVTGLPEGALVQERLEEMVSQPEWGLALVALLGMGKFGDRYGFIAADDVARAASLMIANAMQESGAEGDFVGHLDATTFLIVTAAERASLVAENCRERLSTAIHFFYPAVDRTDAQWAEGERLSVQVQSLSSLEGHFADIAALRAALTL